MTALIVSFLLWLGVITTPNIDGIQVLEDYKVDYQHKKQKDVVGYEIGGL